MSKFVSRSGLLALSFGLALTTTALAENTKVVFGLPTAISLGQPTLMTVGQELGFYEAEGIDLEIQAFNGTALVISQVAAKTVDVGQAGPDPLIVAQQPGNDALPVKFFYNAYRSYIWEFVAPEASAVNTIADLKGKKIGVGALTNSHIPITNLILKDHGLAESDYELVSIGIGAPAFHALTTDQVSAYNTWTANISGFEAQGGKVKRLPIGDRYTQLFASGYFAHQDTLKDNPAILVAFGRALTKAALVCKDVPAWCVAKFWEKYPTTRPAAGGSDEEILASQSKAFRDGLNTVFDFGGGPEAFGSYPDGSWENYAQVLAAGGIVQTANVDVSRMYSNELVDAMNDFDRAEIARIVDTLK